MLIRSGLIPQWFSILGRWGIQSEKLKLQALSNDQQVQSNYSFIAPFMGVYESEFDHHNESIITFDDVARYLELENECTKEGKSSIYAFMAQSSHTLSFGFLTF